MMRMAHQQNALTDFSAAQCDSLGSSLQSARLLPALLEMLSSTMQPEAAVASAAPSFSPCRSAECMSNELAELRVDAISLSLT